MCTWRRHKAQGALWCVETAQGVLWCVHGDGTRRRGRYDVYMETAQGAGGVMMCTWRRHKAQGARSVLQRAALYVQQQYSVLDLRKQGGHPRSTRKRRGGGGPGRGPMLTSLVWCMIFSLACIAYQINVWEPWPLELNVTSQDICWRRVILTYMYRPIGFRDIDHIW